MEFFLELIFTIPFSLLVSFGIAKFLSIADDFDHAFPKNKATLFEEEPRDDNLEGVGPKYCIVRAPVDDQSPELYSAEVEKTGKASQKAEIELGFVKGEVGVEVIDETKLGFGSGSAKLGVSVDDQSPGLFNLGVEKTEEKSLYEAQNTGFEMGFKKEEVGMDEIEETKLGCGSNFANLGEFIGVEKTEVKSLDGAQKTEFEMGFVKEEVDIEENKEISENWEGIERSELERVFGAAVAFVNSKGSNSNFCSDLKLQFFGLYQVAIAGPCLVPKPMALNFHACAKWNAWNQLGSMSSEAAMQHYIDLLSMNIPGWMDDQIKEDDKYDYKTMHL